jgi:hypothetical protein
MGEELTRVHLRRREKQWRDRLTIIIPAAHLRYRIGHQQPRTSRARQRGQDRGLQRHDLA